MSGEWLKRLAGKAAAGDASVLEQTVAQHMARNVLTLEEGEPLSRALELATTYSIRHLPVVSGPGRLVGILTDRDLKRARPSPLFPEPADTEAVFESTRAADLMTRDVITIHPDAPLAEGIRLMIDHKIGAVPAVEEGYLVGILTETDALRACLGLLTGGSGGAE